MIFAADEDLRFLAYCRHWFGDGTFKVVPTGYSQQYTLHGYYDGMTYPCVYALLKGRSEIDYNKFLDEVLDLMPHGVTPNPLSIMTDFELAAIKAFKSNFPLAETSGCYFHLGQSVWKNIQKIGNGVPHKQYE